MNRHHPYGGNFESSGSRRGGFSGPGPDRSHRHQERGGGPTRGRGFGRGRGNYSGYDGNMSHHTAYDSSQNDIGAYNDYDSQAASQESFYANNYGVAAPAQFPPVPPNGYSQGYAKFEDGHGSSTYGDDEGEPGRGHRRPFRREREGKVHDSIIEERIQRERPCRTLFIRNIKYETNSEDVRRMFEEHGDIKTFFDLISTRGMVFVTYYDLRAAERARERLQGSEISGRPIDVHYSLPRDDHGKGGDREKNQQFQGTLQVTLRNSATGQIIDDNEVRRKFQQFGDVKSVTPAGDRSDSRYVEFYDTRACEEAHDRLRHQGLQDGVMDIVFAWDTNEGPIPNQRDGNWEDTHRGGHGGGGGSFRGGMRGRGRTRGRGRAYDDDHERRGDYGRADRDGRGRGRFEDDSNNRQRTGAAYDERFESGRGSYATPATNGYAVNMGPGNYGTVPQTSPGTAAVSDDRLEQARKVQQLLAALKQPQSGPQAAAPVPGPPTPMPPPGGTAGIPGMPPMPPPSGTYYPQPGTGSMPAPPFPPNNPYGAIPPPLPPPSAQSSQPSLPPNILALLQSAQRQPPLTSQYGVPPQVINSPPAVPGNGTQYQQLMTYLQSQNPGKQ